MNRLTVCFVSLLGACALDDDETIVESIEQGVSSTALSSHHCASGTCTYNLGATASSTCVLAGVSGDLAHNGANATIGVNGANWELTLSSGIGAKALCVSTTTNRVQVTVQPTFFNKQPSISGSLAQRCFLSGIHSLGFAPFSSFSTLAFIERSEPKSWSTESLHTIKTSTTEYDLELSVTCIDVGGDNGTFAYGNGSSLDVTGNLAWNPRAGGVACALTGIGGLFDNPYQGVNISYDSTTRYWNWSLDSQTGGFAHCFH